MSGDRYKFRSDASFSLSANMYIRGPVKTLRKELRICVKVEVAVLGSPCLTVRTVFVDVKQH